MGNESQIIVFFDGYCNLCNRSVDFLIKHDKQKKLKFAPLQGSTAKKMLPDNNYDIPNSIVLWNKGEITNRSRAVLTACSKLSGGWRVLSVLRIFPAFLLNWVYDIIAANRYKWYGKSTTCRLPTAQEREQFLP
jgi:predicted DCC family thiol-disulfide oxidoreductase YuxK